jgi:hypothetical protein
MGSIDKHNRLDEEPFSYRAAKEGHVILYWQGKAVKTLSGSVAEKFLKKIDALEGKEAQLLMAKATGNFKHGNER